MQNLFRIILSPKKSSNNFIQTGLRNLSLGICRQSIIKLHDREAKRLKEIFSNVKYDAGGGDEYIKTIRKLAYTHLPERLVDALQQQKTLNARPYIIIEGLPYEEVFSSPFPNESGLNFKKTPLSENLNIAISSIIGEPHSIIFEGHEIVNNIVPHKEHENRNTGLGSKLELDYHIENAALKHTPFGNYGPIGLLLQGIRHQENGPKTRLSSVPLALLQIKDEDLEELKKPQFEVKVPYRWREAMDIKTTPVPIIKGSIDFPDTTAAFYGDMTIPLNENAKKALARFRRSVEEGGIALDIKPGQAVYTDNRLAMHSRDSFTPKYDENGRGQR